MGNGPCGGRDDDMGSGERGTRGNRVAREQPRQRLWRRCRTCGGVRKRQTRKTCVKRAGKGEAGGDAFSGEGDERGRGSRF